MNLPTAPTPRPAHAFAGTLTRSERAKLVPQFEFDLRSAYVDSSTIRLYDKVSVLAFHWANDDIGVVPRGTELLSVFRDDYKFQTSSFTIPVGPGAQPQQTLAKHLMDHANDSAGPNKLRIYVYNGHSRDPGMHGRYFDLSGTLDRNAPVVDWWAVTPYLERYPGSICYIFDTCSAVSAVFESYNWGGGGL